MTPARRWCLVAIGVAVLIGVPLGVRAIPVGDSSVSATALLHRVQASRDHAYSGYVETLGTLQLPVADRFTDVGALFGERTRMRVWWRSATDWRVAKVLATGEDDLIHRGDRTTEWNYEKSSVTVSRDPAVRLPRTADLLPPELSRRLLQDVDTSEISRLASRRVAGQDAPGLRLSPAAPQSSVAHVDLWADPSTGIPLLVEVFTRGSTTAAFTTEFMSFSPSTPSATTTAFVPPAGARVSFDGIVDIADAANHYAPVAPPATLAGLSQSSPARLRAVGVYGVGVTQLIAIPLWDRAAEPLRAQMETTPGVRLIAEGDILAVGPLSVLLTQHEDFDGGWLLAGTVTESTLITAAHELESGARSLPGPPP